MIGGVYLCYEGAEKVYEIIVPHHAQAHEAQLGTVALNAKSLEDEKVASAIKTDFILSAEIMAIALAAIPEGSILTKAMVLVVVEHRHHRRGLRRGGTDREGRRCSASRWRETKGRPSIGAASRALGRGLVLGMPYLLAFLSAVGTAAMIWVGGGIVVHGLDVYGWHAIGAAIHHAADIAANALPAIGGLAGWIVSAAGAGIVGLAIGAVLIPVTEYIVAPAWRFVKSAHW